MVDARGPQRPRPGHLPAARRARHRPRDRPLRRASTSMPTRSRRPPRRRSAPSCRPPAPATSTAASSARRPTARTPRGSTSPGPTPPRWPSSSPAARSRRWSSTASRRRASALKMAYAGWTKGTAALLLTMREAARAHGVEDDLVREWEHSIPSLPERSAQAARQADDEGLAVGGRDARDRRHAGAPPISRPASTRRRPRSSSAARAVERRSYPLTREDRRDGRVARPPPDGAIERLVATIRRRPWPVSPPSSPSPRARSPTRAPRAACAARARCPASSTAATTTRCAFAVDERELRHALAARGAVVELELGGEATPAVLKDAQRHPVRGHTMHVDFLRVNLNVAIHAVVTLELLGGDDAPGTIEGGVLEHVTREVNIEALPNDIPERLQLDVSVDADQRHARRSSARHGARRASRSSTTSTRPCVATLTPPKLQAELEALDEEAALEQETAARRRGRGARRRRGRGRGRLRRRRRRRRELRVARARAPALRRGLGSGRLARRRAGQPGRALRAHAAQRRLRGGRGARAPLGAAAPQAEVRRALHRRAAPAPAARASPCCCPQTFMNEAGNSAGPARGALHLELDRVLVLHDEIDLPFGEVRTRVGGGLAGHNGLKSLRRGPGLAGLRAACASASGARTRPIPTSSRRTCSGAGGEPGRGRARSSARRRRRRAHRARRRHAVDRSPDNRARARCTLVRVQPRVIGSGHPASKLRGEV